MVLVIWEVAKEGDLQCVAVSVGTQTPPKISVCVCVCVCVCACVRLGEIIKWRGEERER